MCPSPGNSLYTPHSAALNLGQGGYSGRYLEAAVKIRSLRPWPGTKIPSLWGCPGRAQWEIFGGGGTDLDLAALVGRAEFSGSPGRTKWEVKGAVGSGEGLAECTETNFPGLIRGTKNRQMIKTPRN